MRKTTCLLIGLSVALVFVASGCAKGGAKTAYGKTPKHMGTIHFDFDSSVIKPDAKGALEKNAAWMKKHADENVVVEGHCDERGTAEYNIALGHRRARSAKSYMISLGVSKKRLKTVSYGEERPAATCHAESCWWKNRRGEFVKK